MSFKQRTQASTVLANVQTGFASDPLELRYSGKGSLNVGDSITFRILSLHEDKKECDAPTQLKRTCTCKSVKDGKESSYEFEIAEPLDKNQLSEIYDDAGKPMSELPNKNFWLIPVLALYRSDSKGKTTEVYNAVRYVKFGPGLVKSLKALSTAEAEGLNFDAIPHYDVRLTVIKDPKSGFTNYKLEPVYRVMEYDEKTEKNKLVPDPHFGVEDLADALGPDLMQVIEDEWDDVQNAIRTLINEEGKTDNVKKKFLHYREENQKDAKADTGRSSGMRKELKDSEVADEPEDEVEDETETETEDPTPPFKGTGRRFGK